jgi:hypothetical protein
MQTIVCRNLATDLKFTSFYEFQNGVCDSPTKASKGIEANSMFKKEKKTTVIVTCQIQTLSISNDEQNLGQGTINVRFVAFCAHARLVYMSSFADIFGCY